MQHNDVWMGGVMDWLCPQKPGTVNMYAGINLYEEKVMENKSKFLKDFYTGNHGNNPNY